MGGPASLFSDAWTYRYNTPTSGSDAVAHAAENWMMFGGINTGWVLMAASRGCAQATIYDSPPAVPRSNGTGTFTPQTPAELAFASELIAYWLSFVRSGNPNTHKLGVSPTWEKYTPLKKVRMVLMQDPQNLTTVSGSYMEERPPKEGDRCASVISKALHTED